MVDKIIGIGNKVDIEYVNPDTKEKHTYKSQVFDIMDNDEIRVAMPFEGTKLVVLSLNIRYKFCFYTKTGLFECVGVIVDRFKSDNQYVAVVSLKTGLRKIQRREFFRLEKLTDIEYRVLTEEESEMETVDELLFAEDEAEERPIYKKGVAVDISGGGARFVLEEACLVNTYMLIRMEVEISPTQHEFYVIGKVVWSGKLEGRAAGQCENRVEFVRIEEREREKLIHYIFREERRLRQVGKS